jgi:DNA repair photolyase
MAASEATAVAGRAHLDGSPTTSSEDGLLTKVEYREIVSKRIINRVHGMPFKWSINPYRGCVHGCHYCYARGTHTFLDLNGDDDFSSIIFVKVNGPDLLRHELRLPSWRRENISIGTATDPYQPAEARFRITRRMIEVCSELRNPLTVVTKGTLIVRDVVCFSIPTTDRTIWRATEPGTAPPSKRLQAMATLAAAGVCVGVLAAPIIPGLSGTRDQLEATVRAAAEHGATFFAAGALHLGTGERTHYMRFLEHEYPGLVPLHARLYAGKYPPREAAEQLEAQVAEIRERYGLPDWHRAKGQPAQTELAFGT